MLVSIHKPIFIFLFFLMGTVVQTQAQTWTLKQCIDTAQVHNKNLQIGKNNIEISTQKQKEAKANLLPKININAEYKYFTDLPYQLMPLSVFGGAEGEFKEAQFGVPHNINVNAQFTMPLYNPQIRGAIEATKIASELKTLQYQKTEEELYFDISNLYFNAQILRNQISFLDSNLVNSNSLLKNVKLLREQLLAKGTDVDKVVLQVEQLVAQKHIISSKYDQVLNALKFMMGVPDDQIIEVESGIVFQKNNIPTNKSTLDIQLAKTQYRLLSSERSTLKSSRLPSVSLFGSYGTTGYGYDGEPSSFLDFYPIGFAGLKVNYPLFNGTITKKKIAQKDIELTNSALQLKLISDKNKMETKNAMLQKNVTQNTITTNESQIQLAQSIYEQTVFQQKQGVASLTNVLLADNALRETQQNYLSAIIEYLKADLELIKLTGKYLDTIK